MAISLWLVLISVDLWRLERACPITQLMIPLVGVRIICILELLLLKVLGSVAYLEVEINQVISKCIMKIKTDLFFFLVIFLDS